MNAVPVSVQPVTLRLWHCVGADAPATLEHAGLPLPEQDLGAHLLEGGFVARPGRQEFLLAVAAPPSTRGQAWLFPRYDRVLALQGPEWADLMRWVCHFDFRRVAVGVWTPVTVAGVDCWTVRRDEHLLWIGCDPSYGDYLQHAFEQVARDHANSNPIGGPSDATQ